MVAEDVISILRLHRSELERRGVRHAALFGSVAKGSAGPASDVDVMVDLEPSANTDVYAFVAIGLFLEDLLHRRVDLSERTRLKPWVRPSAERDAIHAF